MPPTLTETAAGTSPAKGSMADLYKNAALETSAPERPGTEETVKPSSTTEEKPTVETEAELEPADDEQEPEHSGTPEQKAKSRHAWARNTKARRTAETRAIKAEARLELLERQLAELKTAATAPAPRPDKRPVSAPSDKPKLRDYLSAVGEGKDYETVDEAVEAHADALTDWKLETRDKEREIQEKERRAAADKQTHVSAQAERIDAARDKHEDFDAIAFSERLPLNQAALAFIERNKHGYEVLYHLGQNLKDANRISALDYDDTIVELKAIATKITTAPTVKTDTTVPPPPRKVGSRTTAEVDPAHAAWERGDREEYKRLMNEKDQERRKKRFG